MLLHASIARLSRRFLNHERGNVAILFAVSLLPMTAAMALAIDYGRAVSTKQALQSAADAAAISALTFGNLTGAELQAKAQALFDANANGIEGVTISSVNKVPL